RLQLRGRFLLRGLRRGLLLGRHVWVAAAAASASAGTASAARRPRLAAVDRNGALLTVPVAQSRAGRQVIRIECGAPATRAAARPAPGRFARAASAARPAAAAAWRTGEAFGWPSHQLDRTDAGIQNVLQRRLGALVGHLAIAVRDRADLDAV